MLVARGLFAIAHIIHTVVTGRKLNYEMKPLEMFARNYS
jgi:hypothetical protein